MNLNIFQWRSLKTRMTLFTLAIFLTSIWSLAFYSSRLLREDMQHLLGEQQFSTASFVAQELNGELNDRAQGLENIANTLDPALMKDATGLQHFLERHVLTFLVITS